jgi:hypothetical protein
MHVLEKKILLKTTMSSHFTRFQNFKPEKNNDCSRLELWTVGLTSRDETTIPIRLSSKLLKHLNDFN